MPHKVDVVVIGAGVVGLAVAREFAIRDMSVLVLEKDEHIVSGASSGNSGIGCTGYDAPPDSLERKLLRRSILRHPNLYRSLGLSYDHIRKCGALVVAWNHKELKQLPKILQENIDAGDTESILLGKNELLELEPSLNKDALGAVYANREMVTEPWLVPIAYAHSARLHGAEILVSKEVVSADFDAEQRLWALKSKSNEIYYAKHVINCAGIYGDKVHDELIRNKDKNGSDTTNVEFFEIYPRKGQFVVFEKADDAFAVDGKTCDQSSNSSNDHDWGKTSENCTLPSIVIQPVPSQYTKGVIVWKSVYGNVIVGPTAEEQASRTDRSNDEETLSMLVDHARKCIPATKKLKPIGSYSGIRTATQYRDYQIYSFPKLNWITVGGIRSTGLTAAPGIAEYVFCLYDAQDGQREDKICYDKATLPPFLPSLPLCPKPKYNNPAIPSLAKICRDYNQRKDGTVELFGQLWKVTHPLSAYGMKSSGHCT